MNADAKLKPPPAAAGPKEVKVLEHDRELVAARFSPCGKFLFAGSYDGNVYRWDVEGWNKTTLSAHSGWLQGLAFHPDGRRMFTGDSWGGVCCWDYADEAPKPKWVRNECHSRWMRSLAVSPDGSLLATCGADRVVRLWSADDGAPVWESPRQEEDLLVAQFHPAGKSLAVGDLKGRVTDWDLASRKPARQLDAGVLYLRPIVSGVPEINDVGGVRCLAFDASGKALACAGSQPATSGFFTGKPTVVLLGWESGERTQLLQWENADPSEGIALDAAWHPDGSLMAATSGQPGKGAVYFWRPGEKAPHYLDKKFSHSRSVSLDANGRRLAVARVTVKPGEVAGNGRKTGKDGAYLGLISRVHILEAAGIV